jgi:hypothetical protein
LELAIHNADTSERCETCGESRCEHHERATAVLADGVEGEGDR